jgi:hypothetical protein
MVRGWIYRAGEAAHQKKRTEEDGRLNVPNGRPRAIMSAIIEKAPDGVKNLNSS